MTAIIGTRTEIAIEEPAYPERLRRMNRAPETLHTIGDPSALNQPMVAVTGARRATPYGLKWARRLAEIASGRNVCVVTGGALGIEAAAMEAALESGGRCIAVLAHGLGADYEELKRLWACSDKIAEENAERLESVDLRDVAALTPVVLAYDGIAFKYMAPSVFEDGHFAYVQERLRILSGLYGALRPLDGVAPYRLEMQAKARVGGAADLYEYWGDRIYREVMAGNDDHVIVNLASKEYSRCIGRHLQPEDRFVTCVFGELDAHGRVVQKGVHAKMARSDMVRFMAENAVGAPRGMRAYDRLEYRFDESRSTDSEYVFLRG